MLQGAGDSRCTLSCIAAPTKIWTNTCYEKNNNTFFPSPRALRPMSAQSVICFGKTSGKVALRAKKCTRKETKIRLISQLVGATGAEGADGAVRVWGDGSAGAGVFSADAISESTPVH